METPFGIAGLHGGGNSKPSIVEIDKQYKLIWQSMVTVVYITTPYYSDRRVTLGHCNSLFFPSFFFSVLFLLSVFVC